MTPKETPPLPATPPAYTEQDILDVEWAVWYARKYRGSSREIARRILDENPALRLSQAANAERIAATAPVDGLRSAAQFMVTLIDEVYGTDNEGMDLPEEAEFRRYRAVIEAALAEAPARPPDTIEDHGIVFGDPDA